MGKGQDLPHNNVVRSQFWLRFLSGFKDKPNDFMEFFKNGSFTVNGTLKEYWEFIQVGKSNIRNMANL